jgi:ATP-dependent 26S proteasome regulatory subunit
MHSNGIQELVLNLRAGYAFFYCQTEEINRNVELARSVVEKFNEENPERAWTVALWDFELSKDPEEVKEILESNTEERLLLIAKNWQWFLKTDLDGFDKDLTTWVLNRESLFTTAANRRALLIVGNESFDKAIPDPIKRTFLPVEFDLPSLEEIEVQYQFIIDSAKQNPKFKVPSQKDKDAVLRAAKGMTLNEVTNALSYSVIKTGGELDPLIISERKAAEVEKIPGVKIGRYKQKLEDLKGYNNMANFVLGTIDSDLSKGIIILGPGGTGKTTFARAIGSQVKRIVFELELAELFGGIVGDTEKNVREALKFITANAPCIVFIDEIEKGLAGASGGKNGTSTSDDVAKRAMSQLLKWLSDGRPEGVYVIATCNDISSLDPEWIRPGRWDSAPFYVRLPSDEIRKDIWNHYCKVYDLGVGCSKGVEDSGWTGAEIESCCRIAKMMNIKPIDACDYIIPISTTAADKVASLEKWASNKTIPADCIKTKMGKKKNLRTLD